MSMPGPDGWGIVGTYEDAFGVRTDVAAEVRDRLVLAMGGDPADDGPPVDPSVLVIRAGERPAIPDGVALDLEDGRTLPLDGRLPANVPLGYHELRLRGGVGTRRLIVSPGRCLLPDPSVSWGWSAQVYALRSERNFGVGDLRDLRDLADWSADVGAGTILINPLDAVAPGSPRGSSPYYPTSRRFLDPLYLAVEEVPGAAAAGDLAALQARGRLATEDGRIDRDAVMAAKLTVLERIWTMAAGAGREPAFRAMVDERGADLHAFGVFCALTERFGRSFRSWPVDLQHPDAPAVAAFGDEHATRVRFHMWLQWLCEEQLARAAAPVALLGDLPIGADPDGFDAWQWQDVLADGVSVGAPPDALGPHGQNWMLPAFVPFKLRAAGYEPFIALLRSAMRHVSGLRIDHVLGLFRLFWIPSEGEPSDGAYVRMPSDDLLDILALESHRSGTFVVGEDLGTVEDGVRDELDARDILRYQVWWFESDDLDEWSPKALASISTHDLPTIAGIWTGEDERELHEIGQEPDGDWHAQLRDRLARTTGAGPDAEVAEVVVGMCRHLAGAPDRIVVVQLDDALGVARRINVPGTNEQERPDNWSRPLPVTVAGLAGDRTLQAVAEAMTTGRRQRAERIRPDRVIRPPADRPPADRPPADRRRGVGGQEGRR